MDQVVGKGLARVMGFRVKFWWNDIWMVLLSFLLLLCFGRILVFMSAYISSVLFYQPFLTTFLLTRDCLYASDNLAEKYCPSRIQSAACSRSDARYD